LAGRTYLDKLCFTIYAWRDRLHDTNTDDPLIKRALAAYFRGGNALESRPIPSNDSYVTEHEGKHYVVLKNVNGILAVYRVRNTGVLKGLKRWPQEIETMKVMPITNVDPHKPRKGFRMGNPVAKIVQGDTDQGMKPISSESRDAEVSDALIGRSAVPPPETAPISNMTRIIDRAAQKATFDAADALDGTIHRMADRAKEQRK